MPELCVWHSKLVSEEVKQDKQLALITQICRLKAKHNDISLVVCKVLLICMLGGHCLSLARQIFLSFENIILWSTKSSTTATSSPVSRTSFAPKLLVCKLAAGIAVRTTSTNVGTGNKAPDKGGRVYLSLNGANSVLATPRQSPVPISGRYSVDN